MLIRDALEWHNKTVHLSLFSGSTAYVPARGLRKEVRFDPATSSEESGAEGGYRARCEREHTTVFLLMWGKSIFVATSLHLCHACRSRREGTHARFFIQE
jgi:hypothetical protein